jgi:hypothetical protein
MARQDYELPAKFLDATDRFVALANEKVADRSHDEYRTMFRENAGELGPVYQGEAPPERPQ